METGTRGLSRQCGLAVARWSSDQIEELCGIREKKGLGRRTQYFDFVNVFWFH